MEIFFTEALEFVKIDDRNTHIYIYNGLRKQKLPLLLAGTGIAFKLVVDSREGNHRGTNGEVGKKRKKKSSEWE